MVEFKDLLMAIFISCNIVWAIVVGCSLEDSNVGGVVNGIISLQYLTYFQLIMFIIFIPGAIAGAIIHYVWISVAWIYNNSFLSQRIRRR